MSQLTPTPTRRTVLAAALGGALLLSSCSAPLEGRLESSTPVPSAQPALTQIGVAAGNPDAAEIGVDVLEIGGNAVDAAIATAFAVSVLEPHASGIGGGGVTLVAAPGTDPAAFDYREVVAENGKIPASGTGTPGFVDGMWTLHQKYGSLPWETLLTPAAEIASQGFPIPKFLGERMNDGVGARVVSQYPQFRTPNGSRVLKEGETLIQEDLATTIRTLADSGRDAFYTGSIAEELSQVKGLDAATLAAYRTEEFTPVQGPLGDYTVVSAPPALPGAGLIQMLQQAEGAGIANDTPTSGDYAEKLMKAWSNANETVTTEFGDQRFTEVDTTQTLDRELNLSIGRDFENATPTKTPEGQIDPGNTTHLTVVDPNGMMVSMTNTITSFWGGTKSEVVGGFFLNNQLSRFKTIDSPANQPEPGRKSVTWSNPTLVLDQQGRAVLGLGSPGGQQIPNILSSVLVPALLQNADLQEAVDSPRYHLQGGVLAIEGAASPELRRTAADQGWKIRETQRADGIFGSVQALKIDYDTGTVTGATDTRRDGGHVVRNAPTQ